MTWKRSSHGDRPGIEIELPVIDHVPCSCEGSVLDDHIVRLRRADDPFSVIYMSPGEWIALTSAIKEGLYDLPLPFDQTDTETDITEMEQEG